MGIYNSIYVDVFLEVPIEKKPVERKVLKNSKGKIIIK